MLRRVGSCGALALAISLIALAGETGLGDALDTKPVDRKQTAPQHAVAGKVRQWRFCHRGDEQRVEIGAPEHHAGDIPNRHVDHPIDLAGGPVADDLALQDLGVPERQPSASTVEPSGAPPREVSSLTKVRLLETPPVSTS